MKQSEKTPKPAKPVDKSKNPIDEGEIWSRYMDWVKDLDGRRHAFRGQADSSWRVQTSAYRRLANQGIKHPEVAEYLFTGYLHERVNEVRMRFTDHNKKHPLEVMAWMQHHGVATGLIDFTESALVALWFACKDNQDVSGKVIAVRLDNNKKIKEIKNRDDIEKPLDQFFLTKPNEKLWVWRPGDGDSRMITQQSLFIFGVPEITKKDLTVYNFPVLTEEKNAYMKILERMGISENSIFSDFSGFAVANSSDKDYPLHLAEVYYAEKVNDAPKPAEYHFQKGVFNAAREAYRDAVEDFNMAIKFNPQDARAYNNRGMALHALGRHEEAISDGNRAIEIDSHSAAAYNNRGMALHALSRYEEAISDYNRAVEIDSQSAVAYNNRGTTLDTLGRHKEAMSDYNRAIEIDPQDAMAYYNRGNALSTLGSYMEAIIDYNRAIEIDPRYVMAYNNRGGVSHALGRHEEALSDYNQIIKINPRNAKAYNNRGIVLYALGHHKEAMSDYNRAIEIDPQDAEVYYNRGMALHALGSHEEAISDYNRVIEIDPQYATAYNNRGVAVYALGRREEAISDYNRVIEIDPQYAAAYNNRGNALHALDRREEAISDWKEAKRIGEETGNTQVVQSATNNLTLHGGLE